MAGKHRDADQCPHTDGKAAAEIAARVTGRSGADQQQHRRDGQILKKQHAQRLAPGLAVDTPAGREQLQAHRRGRQRQRAGNGGHRHWRQASHVQHRRDQPAAEQHLLAAETKDHVAHGADAIEAEFQPECKKQQRHAQFRWRPEAFRVGQG